MKPTTSNAPQEAQVRLNKFIADCGKASRRKADELIREGSVTVNGHRVFELGLKVDPKRDRVSVDGKPLRIFTQKFYYMFHKPRMVLTSLTDPQGRATIADFVKRLPARVFPVGRLDWDTEGLILLTNDGDFANSVIHPKFNVVKTYLAKISGRISDEQLARLKKGLTIIGGRVKAAEAERARHGDSDNYDWVRISITEGKNRQIHKMFEKIGFDVTKLSRIAIGRLRLGSLERGAIMELGFEEVQRIFQSPLESVNPKRKTQRKPQASGKRVARNRETQKFVRR